jgi:hypothetical protein
MDPASFFSSDWAGLPGSAIELSESDGDTSGRLDVARIIGRAFPAYRAFTRNVVQTYQMSASEFPFGTYPGDKLTYKSKGVVEYTTAPQSEGLGTQSRLKKNDSPIDGAAIIVGDPPNLIQLSMRLPSGFEDIDATIIHQVELQSRAQTASQH